MHNETFDLAIIGGGITGAGVARDAASRGLKVALIEASDFASGTSSRSSKLIHGGIRYLENLEFGLVFEALSERARLFEIAPHLVHPLRFLIPVYRSGRVPAWKMGLGMMAYDALSLYEAPELHQHLDPQEVHLEFPTLQTKDLSGGFTYSDAYMDDDRLVLETLRSARAFGATIANYVKAVGVKLEGERVQQLECEDVESGQRFPLKARHFVASVGPWTDRLGGVLFKNWQTKLRPSKGVHLTFHKDRFPLKHAVVMGAEKRIVFAIPRHEMVIVGTTDTDFSLDPSQVRTEAEDVRYLLQVIDQYFPGVKIRAEDILGCYAGVRPLIDDGAQTESKTSREHEIWTDHQNLTCVAGGKYTTYRLMAQQTVDEVLNHFCLEERVRFNQPCTLAPLNPLVTESTLERARRECLSWGHLPPHLLELLADRHGMEGEIIVHRALHLLPPVTDAEEWLWSAEALHAAEQTMCLHLADFYYRRSPLVLARKDHGLVFAPAIAHAMGGVLGWSPTRQKDEINALQNRLSWDLSAVISG
ncbi:MAG: glycerol-3-phosphate dehydrogenase/oxidase [Bdellovibrionales bacterium]|nr:glycerol-3-phosphate dehydrogenase/oxidase [Bdellovibrionales bacterium]